MQRTHLQTVSVAMLILLAGCPPVSGETETAGTESASGTDTTTEGDDNSNSNPTDTNDTPVTTTQDTDTSGTASNSESNTGTEPTSGTTMTVEPTCSDDKPCEEGLVCYVDACVTCEQSADVDAACAGESADTPVCSPEGACVECTADNASACSGSTPVCTDGACAACTAHPQCPDTACNFETGACFAIENTLYVDRAAPCDVGAGTMDAPFCKITDVFAKMIEGDVTLGWTIKIKGGAYIEDTMVVPDGSLVTFTRWGDTNPKIRAVEDTGPSLTVQNGSTVYVDRLSFNKNDSNAILCAAAKVYIDETRFEANKGQGYESTDCESKINASVIYDNDGGGIASYGAGVTSIVNSFVSGNGTQNSGDYGGIRSAQGNELKLLYSTVANNLSPMGPRSLQCVDAGAGEVRNSVIIGFAPPSIDCPTATFTSSALDEGVVDGDGNLLATAADLATFFEPQVLGVYAAIAGTPLDGLAVWKEGDPKTDYNGTARANTDGGADFAGADKP